MTKLDNLKQDLAARFSVGHYVFTHSVGDDVLEIPVSDLIPVLRHFHDSPSF